MAKNDPKPTSPAPPLKDPITPEVVARVIRKAIMPGDDYRTEVVDLLNRHFLDATMSFFRQVVNAKLEGEKIGVECIDWYKDFIMGDLPPKERAVNAGINPKTVHNIYGSSGKKILIQAADDNYQSIKNLINGLVEENEGTDLMLTIKFNHVSVDLDINESMVVINTLAVKRAAMRGGFWSAFGKRAEKPLMLTLCYIHGVPSKNYSAVQKSSDKVDGVVREVDFFLMGNDRYKCEMKLMGKGNPESADAVVARGSKVFVADTMSKKNKEQMDNRDVEWVELRAEDGWKRFGLVLENLGVPHKEYKGNLEKDIDGFIKKAMAYKPKLKS